MFRYDLARKAYGPIHPRKDRWKPVDTQDNPSYDASIHNPPPQEETQMSTASDLAHMFPVGTRVRFTSKYPGPAADFPDEKEGLVVNHSHYIHVTVASTGDTRWLIHPEEIEAIPATPEPRKPDVNRVHFRYNGTARSGILNFIEKHPGTGNILMWVREDGTGDLKAFRLDKLDPMQRHVGAPLTRSVTVEGVAS